VLGLVALVASLTVPESSRPTAGPERAAPEHTGASSAEAGLGVLPASFIENAGQWPAETRFVAWKGGLAASFSDAAIHLSRADGPAVGLTFDGARRPTLVGEQPRSGVYNFVLSNDPAGWHTGVPAYGSLLYRGLYSGVNVRVREGTDQLEYDVLVAPGGDLGDVKIRAEGARRLRVDGAGALLVDADGGTLRQAPPVAWDETPTGRRPLKSRFTLGPGRTYGFAVEGHDPRRPLVVDPGLEWAAFVGGNGDESVPGLELVKDGTGDVVVAGQTQSPDFTRTGGNLVPVGWTPYVARLSGDGSRLVYATFFGGTGNHSVQDVALDSANRPAVVGDTTSLDFPTTAGAFDRTPGNGFSGDYDAYAITFDAAGGGPVFGTYLGGDANTGPDQAWNAVFDATNSLIVSGFTSSASFPTTQGAYDRTVNGQDLFITRFSPDGGRLTYSTFFGGDGIEETFDMDLDAQGVLSLTGKISQFPDQLLPMPTTPDALDRTFDGGGSYPGIDAYLLRLKPDGGGAGDLRYATFLGGAQYKEGGTGVAVDPNDATSVTVGGWTYSGDFPTTEGALLRTHFGPVDTSMAFVSRFRFPTTGPGSLEWSTLYGAPGNQAANDVVIDAAGRPIIAGGTAANNPPTTERAWDRIPGTGAHRGNPDGFVARLSADGRVNDYMTLLGGGERDDTAQNIAYVGGSSVLVSGLTDSPDFPVTPGAYDTVYGTDGRPSGSSAPGTVADDGFVARLHLEPPTGDTSPPPAPALKGPPSASTYTAPVPGVTFDWTDAPDTSGIAAYHIQVSRSPTFTNDVNTEFSGWYEAWVPHSVEVKSFGISQTGTHHWRVQALDGANNLGPWSEVRTVVVHDPAPPEAPVLVSPPNNGRFAPGSIVLDWNPAARAQYYEIQVDTTSNFSNPNRLSVRGLTATRYTASLTSEGRRWWRVRASNASLSDGPWSAVRSFELKRGSPVAPVPPPDSDGAGGSAPSPTGGATAVARLTPEELSLTGGTSRQVTVHLNGAAPAGGAVVALASRFPELATVPPTVTVPAGSTSAPFTVTAASGQAKGGATAVWAEYGGAAAQGILGTVWADHPSPVLYAMDINGTTVSSGTTTLGTTTFLGGQTVTGTVAFTPGWTAPPGGAVVSLGSTNAAVASVPDRVVVPAGANSASFPVTTRAVSELTRVTILAARSTTHRIVLELLPPGALSALSLSPSTVTGGNPSIGTVTLAGAAPAGGVTVALSSHDTRWATVPPSVTVPAGASSASFQITTSPVTTGQGESSFISATAGGITRTQLLHVHPPGSTAPGSLASLTLNPSTVVGGNTSTGQATLGSPAPPGGVVVSLFSQNTALATVPPSVTIPAGSTGATFSVNTSPITGISHSVNIVAGTSNSSREARLSVTAPPAAPPAASLSSLSLNPSTVSGGTSSTGTVTLTGAAPSGGVVVSLSSGNPAAAVPPTVTVAAGATSASFSVTTSAVSSNTSSVISGTTGGVTRTATLSVNAANPPPAGDTVSITRAEYDSGNRRLRVEATSTSSSATLRAYVAGTETLIGTLANNGGGRYSADLSWSSNPQSITVRSSLGGIATRTVSAK
jgi:hypothetical protein